jgi:glycosyltransferase involved in cell wall biosynthesis
MAAETGRRVALVHDWLNQMGGAENVLEELAALAPGAPIYTSIYAPERMPDLYRAWDIRTSFMQRLPGVAAHHQKYVALYPLAFQQMDLSGYDLVLSNKSGFCHGVRAEGVHGKAVHVCYCLTPTRFLWQYDLYREREQIGGATSRLLGPLFAQLRKWDWAAAQRVDHFIAISSEVQRRIKSIYGRESEIIFPPVDVDYFTPDANLPVGDYYLVVSRLIPYKRIDLAVSTFRHLPKEKLIVVGDGRDMEALKAGASSNVQFLGRQPRARVRELLRGCRAFLFPGLEDFGIAPVEAMSCGRPVIAFGGGGALDTVLEGVTGELFSEPTAEALAAVLQHFRWQGYSATACRAQAERFSAQAFRRELTGYLLKLHTTPSASMHNKQKRPGE